MNIETIELAIMDLPLDEQMKLVKRLFKLVFDSESSNEPTSKEIEAYWTNEAQQRANLIDKGQLELISSEMVNKESAKILEQCRANRNV